jgi:membrane protein YqaA with SNARE-associated domain
VAASIGRLVIPDYGRPTGVIGQIAAIPMRFNFYGYERGQPSEHHIAPETKGILGQAPRLAAYDETNVFRFLALMFLAFVLGGVILTATNSEFALPLGGLFLTSLIAGTVLPFLPASSEMAMAGLLAVEAGPPVALISTAVVGNILGTVTNYFVGKNIARFCDRRWFPIAPSTLNKAAAWFQRYGFWTILMCWLPTFGDAITVVAGLLRANFRVFLILTAIGKGFGHLMVAGGISWLI